MAKPRTVASASKKDKGFVLPEVQHVDYSLTAGTTIPSPPPSPRPQTPDQSADPKQQESQSAANGAAPQPSVADSTASPPTPRSARSPTSPNHAPSKRPQSMLSFFNRRRFSGSTTDLHTASSNPNSAPGSKRPMSPSFSSRPSGTGYSASVNGAGNWPAPGLRKKKSTSWFRRRLSGMPLGIGVGEFGQLGNGSIRESADEEKYEPPKKKDPMLLPGLEKKFDDGHLGGDDMFQEIK